MTESNDKPSWWTNAEKKDEEANYEKHEALNLADGEKAEIEFLTNGKEWTDMSGKAPVNKVIFEVKYGDDIRTIFLNTAHWSVLKSIRAQGFPIIGKKGIFSRKGEGKHTRYVYNQIGE